jgi:hypothetical protein
MTMWKVGVFVALVAVSASAAPLYDQQVELFQTLLADEEGAKPVAKAAGGAPLPFDAVTDKQKKVYGDESKQVDLHNKYETKKRLKPFEVSAARNKAEADEIKKQDGLIKAALGKSTAADKVTNTNADATYKQAMAKAKATDEATMEAIHKELHPMKKAKEAAYNAFIKGVGKQAAGNNVVINADTSGDQFRPGGAGDATPFTAKMAKKEAKKAKKAAKKEAKKVASSKKVVDSKAKAKKAKKAVKKALKALKKLPTAEEMELFVPAPQKTEQEQLEEEMRYEEEESFVQAATEFEWDAM